MDRSWSNVSREIPSKAYVCGHCGKSVSSNLGYQKSQYEDGSGGIVGMIYICHHCKNPTFFNLIGGLNVQVPGARPCEDVAGIDDAGVEAMYKEARDSFSINAFTAAVLSCRKLLMHVAVSKGAPEGQNFIEYVEYLASKGYVPPDAKAWVDQIRKKGNEANHEITIMTKEEATDLLSFVEMLLKLIFEFPSKMRTATTPV